MFAFWVIGEVCPGLIKMAEICLSATKKGVYYLENYLFFDLLQSFSVDSSTKIQRPTQARKIDSTLY